jgi:hypothetical protein
MVLTTKEASDIIVLGIVISVLPISSTMIDSQAPLVSCGETVNNAVYHEQGTSIEGLTNRDSRGSYQVTY